MMKEHALSYVRDFKKPIIPLCWPGHGKISEGHDSTCDAKGKRPLISGWQKYCSQIPEESEVDKWFSTWPEANIGGPTGPIWGIAVDIDLSHGGETTIDNNELPETVTNLTGGGGYHYLYKHPGIQIPNKVSYRKGIDIRGDKGQIVLPPSMHSSGKRYKWKDNYEINQFALSDSPSWLLESLTAKTSGPAPRSESHIPEGKRHSTLVSMAGTMHQKGMSAKAIEAALVAENISSCQPPFTNSEVIAIARDIPSRYPNEIQPGPSINFLSPDMWIENVKEPITWVIEDLFPEGSLKMISAPPKAGKSTFARAASAAVSKGEEFLGKAVKKGTVLYMALEERPDIVSDSFRMLGVEKSTPIYIHFGRFSANAIPELEEMVLKTQPALLVLDTIGRIRNKKLDVSDYSSVGDWLEPFLYLAHETKTCVCALYHDNKSGRNSSGYDAVNSVLGSTAVTATVDQLISIRRDKEHRRTFQTIGRFNDIVETGFELVTKTQQLKLAKTSQEVDLASKEQSIIKYLRKSETLSNSDIVSGINGRAQTITTALSNLLDKELVERSGSGKTGDPYSYSLVEENALPTQKA